VDVSDAGGDQDSSTSPHPDDRTAAQASPRSSPGNGGRAQVRHRSVLGPLLPAVTITMVFFGSLTIVAIYCIQGNDPLIPQPGDRTSATIAVQNKVVTSEVGLVEDRTPSYLSRRPLARCAKRDCKTAGTDMWSGAELVAICFTFGEGLTNMDFRSPRARRNPERVSSDLWYGVELSDRSLGFISEVYLTPASRNGLGLRQCPDPP
jgi:hypothetical protein